MFPEEQAAQPASQSRGLDTESEASPWGCGPHLWPPGAPQGHFKVIVNQGQSCRSQGRMKLYFPTQDPRSLHSQHQDSRRDRGQQMGSVLVTVLSHLDGLKGCLLGWQEVLSG